MQVIEDSPVAWRGNTGTLRRSPGRDEGTRTQIQARQDVNNLDLVQSALTFSTASNSVI